MAGINDNGSGSSALLAIARALIKTLGSSTLVNRVRFCWWAAEEMGLLGSSHYTASLEEAQTHVNVATYLNFDMVASPNFVRSVSSVPLMLSIVVRVLQAGSRTDKWYGRYVSFHLLLAESDCNLFC